MKSSKNERWKKEVHEVVVSCLVDSSSVSADSTLVFSSVRLSSVTVRNKRRNNRTFDRCEGKKLLNYLLKKEKSKDKKERENKHLFEGVTQGEKKRYSLCFECWDVGLKSTEKAQGEDIDFHHYYFECIQSEFDKEKKNRTKTMSYYCFLESTTNICKENGLVDKEKLKSPVMTKMSERGDLT